MGAERGSDSPVVTQLIRFQSGEWGSAGPHKALLNYAWNFSGLTLAEHCLSARYGRQILDLHHLDTVHNDRLSPPMGSLVTVKPGHLHFVLGGL